MKKVLQLSIFLLSLLFSSNIIASHIVGGEINYTYLGGNQYQIDITIYRDCNSTTDFDDPAAIGIFDGNGNLVQTIDINLGPVNQVNASINNPCITPPSSVCTEVTTYTTTVTLPPNGNGYQIVYQRCCRNAVIDNIQDPSNTGATYVAVIPGVAPLNNNSNPTFNSLPPLFICAGTPFTFNHAATDADGDSLVYSLTTPFEGADAINPQPNTPSTPPYTNITWQAPYSQNNMFGGVPLTIDAQTGIITCTPNTQGTFVYAVQVAEYRNGVLIGFTKREYQLTVTNCNNPTVAGFGLTNASGGVGYSTCSANVVFNNTSSNATSYSWDFGDPTTTSDVSTSPNPTYTYPAQGTYNVTLIAISSNCSDTINIPVTITGNISVSAGVDLTACPGNSVQLNATGATTYSWSPTTGLSNPTIANPTASPSATTSYVVTGTDASGCTGTDTVVVTIGTISVSAGSDQTVCNGSCVQLSGSGATTYSWSPTTGLTGANTATPNACPTVTTTYVVTGTSNGCTGTDTVTVFVTTPPNINAGNDTTICPGGTAQLFANGGLSYTWSPSTGLSNPNIANPTASPTSTTTYTVTVTAPSGNVVVNGDFSGGNTGFSSGYVNNSNLQPEGRYFITNDASNNHPNFVGVDHTTGSGNFMAVNGSGTPNNDVWCQTVNVTPNTVYAFSTWVSTLAPGNTAALQFSINGTQLGNIFNAPTTTGTWNQFFQTWNSGTNTTATICIVNQNTSLGGNDFGLDDITFSPTCTATAQVTVTVGSVGAINAGPDQQVCAGASVQLNATGGQNYSWSPATGLSATNIANPISTPTNTISYVVNGTDTLGCSASDTVQVTVNPLPTVSAGQDQNVCLGDSAQLVASGAATYVWTPATGLSSATIANPVFTPSAAGSVVFTVTGTDQNGCTDSDNVTVLVGTPPTAVVSGPVSICPGGSAQLLASGGIGYQWNPATGLNVANIPNPVASPSQTTTYTVTVSDIAGCTDSASVVVTVLVAPTVSAGPDTGFCTGGSLQLLATGATSYAWSPANGLSNPAIANPIASPNVSTVYVVTGTAPNGCTDSDTISVDVWPNPNADAGPDQTVCIGSFVQLQGSGGQTYQWNPSAPLNNDTIYNPVGVLTNTTTFTLTVGNQYGCTDQDQVTITMLPAPAYSVGTDTLICPGGTAQLFATAVGAISYVWNPITGLSNPFIANPTATPPFTQFYTVSITTSTCTINDSVTVVVDQPDFANAGSDTAYCFGQSVQLGATGGVSYEWFPATGLNNPNIQNPVTSIDTSIVYGVITTTAIGCNDTDYVNIVVHPLPNVDAGPVSSPICAGATVLLTATGANTYLWSPAAGLSNPTSDITTAGPLTTSQTFTVTGTDTLGCSNTDTILLNLVPNPTADAGLDTTICPGASVQLNASGGTSYLWSPADGLSSPFISNPMAFPVVSTEYTVTVTDNNGCSDSDTMEVNVFSLQIEGDTTICQGDTVAFVLPQGTSFVWDPTIGVGGTSTVALLYPNTSTTYTVTATNTLAGCITNGQITVNVNPAALANFTVKYMPGCDSLVVRTFNNSVNGDSYVWTWGDSSQTSTAFNPILFLPYGNGRAITMVALANNGCNDTLTIDSSNVVFDDSLMAMVPNVFSPNNDGTNDCFRPEVAGWFENCFMLYVYNRWGELIFESFREGHCWDGRTKGGNFAKEGTYFYVAKVRDLEFKGYVQLIE